MTRVSTAPPGDVRVFRAPSATVGAIVAALVAAALLVDAGIRAGLGETLLLAPWVLLVLWFAEFPWTAVRDIELRWQVRFRLNSGVDVASFGGPVAGRPGRPPLRLGGERREPPAVRDMELLREQWITATQDETVDGPPAVGETPVLSRHWDIPALIALAVIAAWAVSVLTIVNVGA